MAENILFEDNFDDMSNQVVTASAGTVTAVSNRAELFHTSGISWNVNGFRMSTSVLGFRWHESPVEMGHDQTGSCSD